MFLIYDGIRDSNKMFFSKNPALNIAAAFYITVSIPLFSHPHPHHFLPRAPLADELSFRY